MGIYIALLRGINVGGKNIIKMNDLKNLFEELGFSDIKTYIQSGNVIFRYEGEKDQLVKKIEHRLEASFGFPVPTILRTAEELKQIIKNCPFSEKEIMEAEAASDAESLYVGLLGESPREENTKRLEAYRVETEKYRIIGQEIYLLFYDSIRNSKLASNLHRLEVPVTTRNWKTINKLSELVNTIIA